MLHILGDGGLVIWLRYQLKCIQNRNWLGDRRKQVYPLVKPCSLGHPWKHSACTWRIWAFEWANQNRLISVFVRSLSCSLILLSSVHQVDLGEAMLVHGLGTLGDPTNQQWTRAYKVSTSTDGQTFADLLDTRDNKTVRVGINTGLKDKDSKISLYHRLFVFFIHHLGRMMVLYGFSLSV